MFYYENILKSSTVLDEKYALYMFTFILIDIVVYLYLWAAIEI